LRYIVSRLLQAIPVAVTVTVIGFGLLRISGDVAVELAGESATPEEIARIEKAHGLDRPFHEQYFGWVHGVARGDLGRSLFTNQPVLDLILERLGVTLTLAVCALALSLALSIPLGVLAAIRPNSWLDRAALLIALVGQAIPAFWLGLVLIYIFGVVLRVLPISGSETAAHFVLPVITLSVLVIPGKMRLTRAGMIEALGADFIRTAWSKGLAPRTVLFKHALRNAILPVVSISAVQLGFLLGGSVIIESVFGLNGIGLLAFESIKRADFPVVQSILVFVSLCYILLTLASDVLNALLDPRIRLS
jgi:peptide/nickel transport system permease protein